MRPRAKEASSAASGGRHLVDATRDLRLRRHVQVVFGKVDASFEQRDELHERLLCRSHAPAKRTTHLARGLARLRKRLRIDEVANRFGLRQVEPPGKKRALGKLSRLGQTRAELQRPAQQELQHHRRPVRGNLHKIFGCVGIRRGKESHQRFVDSGRASASVRVERHRPAARGHARAADAAGRVAMRWTRLAARSGARSQYHPARAAWRWRRWCRLWVLARPFVAFSVVSRARRHFRKHRVLEPRHEIQRDQQGAVTLHDVNRAHSFRKCREGLSQPADRIKDSSMQFPFGTH